jgi:5,6-dimethylbenzimidazole synthase
MNDSDGEAGSGRGSAEIRRFDEPQRLGVYRAIHERRDMRHFAGGVVDPDVLLRLLQAAHHAPSVGFMQPWRFIRITQRALREHVHALVEHERQQTALAVMSQ